MIKKFNVEKTRQLNKINTLLSVFYHKPDVHNAICLEKVRNILIVDFALIGDMVMNIPFLKTIKHNCPEAKITMVCMPWAETVLGDQGLIDKFIKFDGKNKLSSPQMVAKNFKEIRLVLKLINENCYEIGIEPKGDLRHILFLHYTKCIRTVSYNYTGGNYLITDCFEPKQETKHLVDEKLDLLSFLGFRIYKEDLLPKLRLSKESTAIVQNFIERNNLENKFIIGLHPGASNINKQYPNFPLFVQKITKQIDDNVVFCVFEGNGEKEIADSVCNQMNIDQIRFIRVKQTLKEYVAIVSICRIMICNDSAAGHLAAAYGANDIIVFGPVKPETALPRGEGTIKFVSHDLPCKPCTLPICPNKTNECILLNEVDELHKAFVEIYESCRK